MKWGLFAINYGTCADPESAVRVARHAEAAGFESVWTGEHVVLPDPSPPGFAIPPELPFLDTVVALTWVAAHTTTLRLGTGVVVLPLRNPVVLAKELASLDVVSGGRLIVGVAAGYVPAEFAVSGVPIGERGARTDDYLRVLSALWGDASPRHDGAFVTLRDVDARPRPLQRPGPPVLMGGDAPAALRRAVALADGWYGFGTTPAEAGEQIAALRAIEREHGRPGHLGPLEITVTPLGRLDRATVERYAELGVHRLVVLPDPGAAPSARHVPVPVDRILRNIDAVAAVAGTAG